MIKNKLVLVVGGVLAALLIATIISVMVLINAIRAQDEEARYRDCMARQGYAADEPPAAVTTDEELDLYLDQITDAAELCAR
ncbi:hypothetical protein [Microbacterium sp. NPDC056569]|uniref:hypothetical protein n=1 Tax=Microbacterium sp. NPDC056569 TaxID=3345867 RepID=UPI00366E7CB2